jgi:hypothetical protein
MYYKLYIVLVHTWGCMEIKYGVLTIDTAHQISLTKKKKAYKAFKGSLVNKVIKTDLVYKAGGHQLHALIVSLLVTTLVSFCGCALYEFYNIVYLTVEGYKVNGIY